MPQKPILQFGVGPAIALLRRFAVRYAQPFLVRPFEGAAEERSLKDGLKQIAGALQAMGTLPEDQIVKQIGSEFRLLFCPAAPPGRMKSHPRGNLIDPVKSISELLREQGTRAETAALRRFVALCRRPILSRFRRSFL